MTVHDLTPPYPVFRFPHVPGLFYPSDRSGFLADPKADLVTNIDLWVFRQEDFGNAPEPGKTRPTLDRAGFFFCCWKCCRSLRIVGTIGRPRRITWKQTERVAYRRAKWSRSGNGWMCWECIEEAAEAYAAEQKAIRDATEISQDDMAAAADAPTLPEPGGVARAFVYSCFGCGRRDTYVAHCKPFQRETANSAMRNYRGWKTLAGKWHCRSCIARRRDEKR